MTSRHVLHERSKGKVQGAWRPIADTGKKFEEQPGKMTTQYKVIVKSAIASEVDGGLGDESLSRFFKHWSRMMKQSIKEKKWGPKKLWNE